LNISLPISKSIANRLLLLQAIHGDGLMRVSSDMPDDVIVLHDALQQLREHKKGEPLTLYLKNCGTALRFLQVHLEYCYKGEPITLTGDPRLLERDGKPTTQTTSALILHGEDIPVAENESPYITMSRRIKESYLSPLRGEPERGLLLEACWSSASYWYEYIAIHGGELLLEGLKPDSLQGDRIVADLYAAHFGVETTFTPEGALIRSVSGPCLGLSADLPRSVFCQPKAVSLNFERIPDLYPAIALTCEKLGIELKATGIEKLRYKESDRIEAVRLHEVRNDHRMAMALMCADFPVSEQEQGCIAKSFPEFVEVHTATTRQRHGNDRQCQYEKQMPSVTHITPKKGINDDNMGKKHALSKLIHAATTEYVWLHDDDVVWPEAAEKPYLSFPEGKGLTADLYILPLRMESEGAKPSLLEKLQIAEYAAIQELTMQSAKAGKAVMCSGANLIVKREVWLACEGDLHPEIPSGDDMFLLESVKRRGYQVGVMDEAEYTAVVRPLTQWCAFFKQRMRWAGKAPKYTDRDILRCGALVTAANILQFLCPLVILIKFPIEYRMIKKREPQTSWYVALLLEIVYPLYLFISLLGGLFRRREW
jgi:5-enolpyruvylshikimate-3-phosphate synthase